MHWNGDSAAEGTVSNSKRAGQRTRNMECLWFSSICRSVRRAYYVACLLSSHNLPHQSLHPVHSPLCEKSPPAPVMLLHFRQIRRASTETLHNIWQCIYKYIYVIHAHTATYTCLSLRLVALAGQRSVSRDCGANGTRTHERTVERGARAGRVYSRTQSERIKHTRCCQQQQPGERIALHAISCECSARTRAWRALCGDLAACVSPL